MRPLPAWGRAGLAAGVAALSLPAWAHGRGLALVALGGPWLLSLFGVLLIRAACFIPRRHRARVLLATLLAVPLGLFLVIGPLFNASLERWLLAYEFTWALGAPLLVAVLGWLAQNRLIRAHRSSRKVKYPS